MYVISRNMFKMSHRESSLPFSFSLLWFLKLAQTTVMTSQTPEISLEICVHVSRIRGKTMIDPSIIKRAYVLHVYTFIRI